MAQFLLKIADKSVELGSLKAQDRELFSFAMENLLYSCLTWGVFLILGLLTDCFWGCVFFIITYIPIRVYAGGYHQKTRLRCFFTSLFLFVSVIVLSYILMPFFSKIMFISLMTVSTAVICVAAPVPEEKNPLSENEYRHCHRNALRISIVIYVLVVTFTLLFDGTMLLFFCVASNSTVAVLILIKLFFRFRDRQQVNIS